ncbi:MAG: thioredoxin fold domain-containing protein [Deltaproteobacteria bacterium]|nr:thioredoxin fold domain-containing protein [Deltaproteobacteria bacterium]
MKIKFPVLLLLSVISVLFLTPARAKTNTVAVDVIHSTDKYEAAKRYPVLFRLTVASGWYIHGTTKEDYLIPTALVFGGSDSMSVDNIVFPVPQKKKFEYTDNAVDVYSGTFYVQGMVKVGEGAAAGLKSVSGELSYQACSKASCLAPETVPVKIGLEVAAAGTVTTRINQDIFLASRNMETPDSRYDSGILWALLWVFLGGLALNLTPCIYPLIPVTVSYFGGRGNRRGGHAILLGILYILGLAVTNSILGVTAALTGGILGAALQYPLVLVIIALIMVLLGLSFFGLWEVHVPGSITRLASKNFSGYFGTFFMGLTLGIVAAPCLGPFVLGLLTYVGQKGDPFTGFLYFFVLSIGIGLPLCVLAIFSSTLDRLPRSGDWMLWVKKVMGWVMISMGYYFLGSLIKSPVIYYVLFGVIALGAAIHLGWLDKTGARLKFFSLMKRTAGVLIILCAGTYIFTAIDLNEHVSWAPFNETILEEARVNKQPVILDVYADWCLPCRHMEKTVFNKLEVVELSKKFTTLRLDITRKQPEQEGIRARYSIDGAPTIIFFDKQGNEIPELRVEAQTDAEGLLSHMKKALGGRNVKFKI